MTFNLGDIVTVNSLYDESYGRALVGKEGKVIDNNYAKSHIYTVVVGFLGLPVNIRANGGALKVSEYDDLNYPSEIFQEKELTIVRAVKELL